MTIPHESHFCLISDMHGRVLLTYHTSFLFFFFFFNDTATTEIYTLSLHDALPICQALLQCLVGHHDVSADLGGHHDVSADRSEEHTSELQSPCNLVCRLLLEKKKKT